MEEENVLTSKAFKRVEVNLKSKLKPTFLNHYPHYLVPGFNLHNGSFLDDIDLEDHIAQYQEYPYHSDLPRPLLPPAKLPRSVINNEDPAVELINIKHHMNDDIGRIKHYYNKHKKDFRPVRKKDIKWSLNENSVATKVPKYVADIAEIIDRDPDPYFKGAYNWYYTGGTLDHVQLNNLNILLFPFVGELVAASVITLEDFLWQPLLQNSAKCEINDTLYELKHNILDDTCIVLGRHKYHCNFYKLSEHNNVCSLSQIHQERLEVPYVSADLNLINTNQYCSADVERSVTLWDMTRMEYIARDTIFENTTLGNAWGSVRFHSTDPNILLFTDRCCLHYLDVRLPFDRPALTLCPKFHLEKCESLSLEVASRNSSCTYLGTYHNFVMCDDRSPEQCVQQKWTHQFKSPPLMASLIDRDDNEFIVISSQHPGDSTIILNAWTNDEISQSFSFPYTPPNIMETLNESQMKGMCLNPYLKSRFKLCNVGSQFIQSDAGDLFLFTQNSIGDIYYQCVTHDTVLDKYSSINYKSYYILNSWVKAINEQNETVVPLSLSQKANMQHVYDSFTNRKLRLKCEERKLNNDFDPSWKQSVERLGFYMDILAPELLAVWEMEEDDTTLPLSAAPHLKVLNWLESSSTKSLVPSQEETDDMQTPVNTQELISVSQEQDIVCLDDSNMLQQFFLPKVRTTPVRRKRKT